MRTLDELTMYVYGLLEEPQAEAMKAHVESCDACAEATERIRSEHELFEGALGREPAVLSGRARVIREVLARRSPPRREAPALSRTAALLLLRLGTGVAALISLAVLLFVDRGGSPTRHEGPALTLPEPEPPPPRRQVLAYVQDAVVGSILARDEEGRTVGELGLKSHHVGVEILDGIARTTVEENFENHTDRRLEGTFHFPLPPDASISRLALEVNGKIEEGTCLERERAREVFESIVRSMKDPALLEWMPGGLFKCRIFPIEPRATKRVIVAYTQALPYFRGTMSYVYPLVSEKTAIQPPEELRIDVQARFSGALARMECPSHRVDVHRRNPREASLRFSASNVRPKNDFVVTLETEDEELRVIPHKTDGDDGYFALLLTPRGAPERRPDRYVFLLDVSASVTAPELEVAKRLVRAMIENRIPGDRFEILASNIEVASSGEVDLRAANDFLDRLQPVGGSDVLSALRAAPEGEIVYIGKGAPTFGETDPARILEAVKGRRIRTVGVGSRANVDLLQKLGGHHRVNPSDDVGRRVAEIAATLGSPVLSGITVEGGDPIYDVAGNRDTFYGERLVVTGRYRGPTAKLVVSGRGYRREIEVTLPPKEEANNYVRRLWAQRKIADLLVQGEAKKQEITDLGVRHQIMTPYTSFLVLENEQMWKDHQLKREVQKQDQVMGEKAKSPGKDRIGTQGMEIVANTCLRRMEGKSRPERVALAEAFSKFVDEYASADRSAAPEYLRIRNRVLSRALAGGGGGGGGGGAAAGPSREMIDRELQRLRESLDDVGVDIVNRANLAVPGIDEPGSRLGPGFASQGSGQRNAPLIDQVEVPTTTNQFGGLEFSLGEASRVPAVVEEEIPVVSHIPIIGSLFQPSSSRPKEEERIPARFTLVSNGTPQSVDLPRVASSDLIRVDAIRLKFIQPPPMYAAKVEEGKIIAGRPLMRPPTTEELLRQFPLRKAIDRLMTRDAAGQVLGKAEFDPQTRSFIVRDTKSVLDRIDKLIAEVDVAPAPGRTVPAPYAELRRDVCREVTLSRPLNTFSEFLSEFQRQTGWQVTLDREIAPQGSAPSFIVYNQPARHILQSFAELAGLVVEEGPPGTFRLLRPSRGTYVFRGVDARSAIESLARQENVKISVSPRISGTVTLSVKDVTWTEALSAAVKSLGAVIAKDAEGTLRVLHPDELLREMDTRVFRIRFIEPPREAGSLELVPVLEALLSRNEKGERIGRLSYDPLSNTLIVRDIGPVRDRINELAAALDVEPGRTPGQLVLKHFYPTRVRELVREIRLHLGGWGPNDPMPRDRATLFEDLQAELDKFRHEGAITAPVLAATFADDEITLGVGANRGCAPGQLFAVTRESKLVAILQVAQVADETARAGVWRGLALGRVIPGDRAERLADVRAFLSGLPEDVRRELASRESAASVRAKMGLKE